MNREKWIEEVLQTAKTVGIVESNPYIATRIEAKLKQQPALQVSPRWVYATLAVLTVIVLVNIAVWRTVNNSSKQSAAVQQLAEEYGWASHDFYSANSN
jgi:hypothetical protein